MPMQRTTGTHWVFRLIPPRPTFDQDMTEAEREIMGRHATYWAQIAERGRVVVYGPVRDQRGSWGLGVLEASSEDEVRELVDGDPAVTTGMARMDTGRCSSRSSAPDGCAIWASIRAFAQTSAAPNLSDEMDALAFEHHLTSPQGKRHVPPDGFTVTAGGGACCDEITFSIQVDGETVTDAGFDANGCGSAHAAGSAAVTLVRGTRILDAARVGTTEIADELGGLSPGKLHAAELAADALARALGQAVKARGAMPAPSDGPARTLVAMSGGVDSAVAAHLCAATGPTAAVTLELWADRENDAERSCCSATAVAQARALAHSMELPHFTIDLRDEFRAGVVEPFIAGYAQGETPNPCVGCNGHVRLDAMVELADRLGCATLATGHYARTAEPGDPAGPLLRAAEDPAKDQTYMLAALDPASLKRLRFPLGGLRKPQVRALAAEAGLPVASKADSQDLCFLAGTDRARFLARHGEVGDRPGELVATDGTVLGAHLGQHRFTVGQRRGLGVVQSQPPEPLYVLDKDAASGRVTVGPKQELATTRVQVRSARLHRPGARVDSVKLRYRSQPLRASVSGDPEAGRHRELSLQLDEPVDGAAPGQLACLMDGDLVVGWGTITRPRR